MPWFPPHVPVAARRARVARVSDELRRNGVDVQPVHIEGRTIARSFWGRRWCHHLESCSDFENRLPRGRAYVRNGSVCHLDVHAGGVDAMVVGSDLYHIVVRIRKLGQAAWKAIRAECAGRVGSVLELLQGRLSDHVLRVVTDPDLGLFPKPGEITLTCDCPDWAVMCKHAPAVLYGVGSRLDQRPRAALPPAGRRRRRPGRRRHGVAGRRSGGRRPRRRSRGTSSASLSTRRTAARRPPGRGPPDAGGLAAGGCGGPAPRRPGSSLRAAGWQSCAAGADSRSPSSPACSAYPGRRCTAGKRPAGRSPSEPVRRTPCRCCTGKSRNARLSDPARVVCGRGRPPPGRPPPKALQ